MAKEKWYKKRTYQSHTAPRRCGVLETFQDNGPTYVDSSSRRTQTVSGRYGATGHSKSIAMFSAFDPPTKVATTRLGSTFHTPTLGWSIITVFATLSAPSMTAEKARKEAILMTTCDHLLCRERVFHMKTRGGGCRHQGVRGMNPKANELQFFFASRVLFHFVPVSFGSALHMWSRANGLPVSFSGFTRKNAELHSWI